MQRRVEFNMRSPPASRCEIYTLASIPVDKTKFLGDLPFLNRNGEVGWEWGRGLGGEEEGKTVVRI